MKKISFALIRLPVRQAKLGSSRLVFRFFGGFGVQTMISHRPSKSTPHRPSPQEHYGGGEIFTLLDNEIGLFGVLPIPSSSRQSAAYCTYYLTGQALGGLLHTRPHQCGDGEI